MGATRSLLTSLYEFHKSKRLGALVAISSLDALSTEYLASVGSYWFSSISLFISCAVCIALIQPASVLVATDNVSLVPFG